MLQKNLSPIVIILLTTIFISGCGGSDTTIVERDPIPVEDDHDEEVSNQGRLIIAEKDKPNVNIIDINDHSLLGVFTLSAVPNAIYPSPSYRYGYIIQRMADTVNIIDGGLWQEDHGDHLHDYDEAPLLMNFQTSYSRPTHFTDTEEASVIFYDGNMDTATPASVNVFTEADIANNTAGTRLEYITHMHGAAQSRGDYLLSTIRDPLSTITLPTQVGIYLANDGIFEEQEILSEPCPGLHGSAQNTTQIVFGCTDGVLLVTQVDNNFSAQKIPNPEIFIPNMRIGTLVGNSAHGDFIGIASGRFFLVNTTANSIVEIHWLDEALTTAPIVQGYGFADGGELFVILDNQGWLTLLNTDDWSVKSRLQVITSNLSALPEGARFELALTPGHVVYVSDPIANQIKQVHLDDGEVRDSIQLNFTPAKLAWLGVIHPTDHHHDH